MLHCMFGDICEVAVHDLSNLDKSLIHVSGKLNGRSIGSPATDLVLREYRKSLDDIEDIYNCLVVTPGFKHIMPYKYGVRLSL